MDLGTDLLIAGELRGGRGTDREVENPATGEVLATVADADENDLDAALSAAAAAWPQWAATPEPERAGVLRRLAALIQERAGELADIVVAELGKPITEAVGELGATVGFLTHTASLLETRAD